jgi:transcriptional regulator with XRE-family HTH domain
MGGRSDLFKGIDKNIAANVRAYREAEGVSQEELAQRMAGRGFGFSQATVWKIESGQRPVRASELIALADSLKIFLVTSLTREPDATRYTIQLQQTGSAAADAYRAVKAAAAAYLNAQAQLAFAARESQDAGYGASELYTSWLDSPPEEAVLEARVEYGNEDRLSEHLNDEVGKILSALRSSGYEPVLRPEDIEYHGVELPEEEEEDGEDDN